MVVYSEFSVLLWSKALVLDSDQAEQNSFIFLLTYLQDASEVGKIQTFVRASVKVKGMERANKKSDKARLKMKIFRAVRISFFHMATIITIMLEGTRSKMQKIMNINESQPRSSMIYRPTQENVKH